MDEKKKKRLKRFQTDVGKIRNRAQAFGSGKFWNPKPGVNKVRILPPWNEEGVFYKEIVWHYGFNMDGQNRAFPCLRSRGQSKCPACQVVARFAEETDSDIKAIIQKMKPKGKWFMNIIDRKAEEGEVKIYGATFSVAKVVLAYFSDEDYGDITDPDEGRDIVIEREGTGFTTKYSVRPGAKPTGIRLEGWEDKLHDLNVDTVREEVSGKKMLEMLESIYGDTLDLTGITYSTKQKPEPEVDEEEEPPKKTKKTAPTVDDDEPEEKPKKQPKKKPLEDDDDDDTDLGDEDDD